MKKTLFSILLLTSLAAQKGMADTKTESLSGAQAISRINRMFFEYSNVNESESCSIVAEPTGSGGMTYTIYGGRVGVTLASITFSPNDRVMLTTVTEPAVAWPNTPTSTYTFKYTAYGLTNIFTLKDEYTFTIDSESGLGTCFHAKGSGGGGG